MALSVQIARDVFRIPLLPHDLLSVYALRDEDGQITLVPWQMSPGISSIDFSGPALATYPDLVGYNIYLESP